MLPCLLLAWPGGASAPLAQPCPIAGLPLQLSLDFCEYLPSYTWCIKPMPSQLLLLSKVLSTRRVYHKVSNSAEWAWKGDGDEAPEGAVPARWEGLEVAAEIDPKL